MSVKVVTDSTADIPADFVSQHGLRGARELGSKADGAAYGEKGTV